LSIVHELVNEANVLHKSVDGAWMDTKLRKLCDPVPEIALEALLAFLK
jgi:acyl-CoA thioester hydrolase